MTTIQKSILFSIIIFIATFLLVNNSVASDITTEISHLNEQLNSLASNCKFDKYSYLKRKFLFKLDYRDITNETIPDIAKTLDYLNDYIVNAILMIESNFEIETNPIVFKYLKRYNIQPAQIYKSDYRSRNLYSKFAHDYKVNADKIIDTYKSVFKDEIDMAAIRIGAGGGAVGASTAAILSGMVAAGTAAAGTAATGTACSLAATSATLSGPFIIITGPAIVAGGGSYVAYKSYKKWGQRKKILPLIDACNEYYGSPIDKSWRDVITDYREEIKAARGMAIYKGKEIYGYLENHGFDLDKIEQFKKISRKNDAMFHSLNSLLKFYLFDEPLRKFIMLTNLKVEMAKGILNDNEEEIMIAGRDLSRYFLILHNTSSQETRNMMTDAMKNIKSELSEQQYKEMKTDSKIAIKFIE